mgnify:CR=1 FL=1
MRVLMPRSRTSAGWRQPQLPLACMRRVPELEAPPLPPVTLIMVPPGDAADSANVPPVAAGVAGLAGLPMAPTSPSMRPSGSDDRVHAGRPQLRADCNRGNAGYTAGANRALSLTPAATTKMGCPPGSKDTVFLRQLAEVSLFVWRDGGLAQRSRQTRGRCAPHRSRGSYFGARRRSVAAKPRREIVGSSCFASMRHLAILERRLALGHRTRACLPSGRRARTSNETRGARTEGLRPATIRTRD